MAEIIVKVRAPFPPHAMLAQVRAAPGFRYGLQLMEPTALTLRISRADPNDAQIFELGNMISVEPDDGLLPWAGFITDIDYSESDPYITIACKDHAGALYQRARTAKTWPAQTDSAGKILSRIWLEADARRAPPLVTELPPLEGPHITIITSAEPLLSFMRDLAQATDWEWGIAYQTVRPAELTTELVWRERIGADRRNEVIFEQGSHFANPTYRRSAGGQSASSVAVGGTGTFASRAAVEANASGQGAAGIEGIAVPVTAGNSPALMGSQVAIMRNVTDSDALARAARRMMGKPPELIGNRITMKLVESRIDIKLIEIGGIYSVRFKDILMGLSMTAAVRCVALTRGTDGILEMIAEVR
jgi:hypothetical protein